MRIASGTYPSNRAIIVMNDGGRRGVRACIGCGKENPIMPHVCHVPEGTFAISRMKTHSLGCTCKPCSTLRDDLAAHGYQEVFTNTLEE